MKRILVGVLLGTLGLAAPLMAQETRGALEGVVRDNSGGVLPGVTVEATGATGTVTSITDENGTYRFPALSPGQYEMKANLQGFTPATAPPVIIEVGKLLKVDIGMTLAGITETVRSRRNRRRSTSSRRRPRPTCGPT